MLEWAACRDSLPLRVVVYVCVVCLSPCKRAQDKTALDKQGSEWQQTGNRGWCCRSQGAKRMCLGLGAKVREAGRLVPIPFSPLSSHFEMTGMGIQSPQPSFPSCSAAAISSCPSTDVTLEISPCGRACPRRIPRTPRTGPLHAHAHIRCRPKVEGSPRASPARRRLDGGSCWWPGDDRDRDEPLMIKLPACVCRHSGMGSCAGSHWAGI